MHKQYSFIFFTAAAALLFLYLGTSLFFPSIVLNKQEAFAYAKKNWIRGASGFPTIPPKTAPTILILGDSTVASGVLPKEIERLSQGQYRAYNIAIVSHDIIMLRFLLEDFIKTNYPPDYIWLNPSYPRNIISPSPSFNELWYMATSYGHTLGLKPFIDRLFPALGKSRIKIFLSRVFDGFNFTPFKEDIDFMFSEAGAYYWDDRFKSLEEGYIDPDDKTTEAQNNLDSFSEEYFAEVEKFMNLCNEHSIKVMLFTSAARDGSVSQTSVIPERIENILQKYSFVKIAENGWQTKFYNSTLFFNRGHLNYKGAGHYTRDLFNNFKQCSPQWKEQTQ